MLSLFNMDSQYFLQIAQAKSLNTAARQLGITAAALTLIVQRLEKRVGAKLFQRTVQGVQLTPAGSGLYETLNRAVLRLDGEVREALSQKPVGQLRIGVAPDDFERYVLPVIAEMRAELPPLKVFCRASLDLYRAVEDGRLDFAWVSWYSEPTGPLVTRRLRPQIGGIIGSKKHFGKIGRVKSRSELSGYPIARIPRDPEPAWASLLDNSQSGYLVRDFSTLRRVVLDGIALGYAERDLFTRQELKQLFFALPDEPDDAGTFLVHRREIGKDVSLLMESILLEYRKRL